MESSDGQTRQAPDRVGAAWVWLVVFTGGMTGIAFAVWGSLFSAPGWFHTLFAFQVLWAIAGLVSAYKRRAGTASGQTPV